MNDLVQPNTSNTAFQDEVATVPTLDSQTSTLFPQHRIVVTTHSSPWMQNLSARLNEVVSLPVGWDGYAGAPVTFATAQFAAQMIERLYVSDVPTPSIVPGSDGTLQVEWHAGGYDVELDVQGPLAVEAYRLKLATGNVEELEIESDFTQVAQWIADIALARRDTSLDQAVG